MEEVDCMNPVREACGREGPKFPGWTVGEESEEGSQWGASGLPASCRWSCQWSAVAWVAADTAHACARPGARDPRVQRSSRPPSALLVLFAPRCCPDPCPPWMMVLFSIHSTAKPGTAMASTRLHHPPKIPSRPQITDPLPSWDAARVYPRPFVRSVSPIHGRPEPLTKACYSYILPTCCPHRLRLPSHSSTYLL